MDSELGDLCVLARGNWKMSLRSVTITITITIKIKILQGTRMSPLLYPICAHLCNLRFFFSPLCSLRSFAAIS